MRAGVRVSKRACCGAHLAGGLANTAVACTAMVLSAQPCLQTFPVLLTPPNDRCLGLQDIDKAKANGLQLNGDVELVSADVTKGAEYVAT